MTTPAAPPISIQNISAELRIVGSGQLNYDHVKRLAGLSRLATGVSLSQLLGKTRPYWAGVDAAVSGNSIGYSASSLVGALFPSTDVYFGNVQIRQLMTTTYGGATVQTGLVFASDPGFRNDVKARLLDEDFGFIREVTLTYSASTGNWFTPELAVGSAAATLFTGAGSFELDLIKL
ncbi:hypothetical protein K2O51_23305 [Cupriavidus pinatubonensis]|uniref:hypothetical protein n=1 Tax=Cupriavidus pinatubonensis TaxID=248026 RepID=UPI001C739C7D|nr:hypothetical protein [Cupriavidus pinatubonensis]QYY30300.1 hypothetical protein K2O51_23305 [Cupriavidus pinatubonensis]